MDYRGKYFQGRMVKYKGVAASIAPRMGIAVLVAGLSAVGSANAALECVEDEMRTSTFNCEGGDYSSGIIYDDVDGLTLNLNDPTITVRNDSVRVDTRDTSQNSVIVNATQFDRISTTDEDADAIYVKANNPSSKAEMSVIVGSGKIEATGKSADGVVVRMLGLGDARVQLGGGSITVSGYRASGLGVGISNDSSTANSTALMTDGSIATFGNGGHAVFAFARMRGDVSAQMDDGKITTVGDVASGVYSAGEMGVANTTARMNGGSIVVSGKNASGLHAYHSNATANPSAKSATIMTKGNILVKNGGGDSAGIIARINSAGTAYAQMSGGTIKTEAESHGLYSYATRADRSIQGTTNNTVTATSKSLQDGGDISTMGSNSHGHYVRSKGFGDTSAIFSGGSITTSGKQAIGLYSWTDKGDALIEVKGGVILTTGIDADGIVAKSDDNYSSSTFNGNASIFFKDGDITTKGRDSSGIVARTEMGRPPNPTTGDATIVMEGGKITTHGGESKSLRGSHGIMAWGMGAGDASITINGGEITTKGKGGNGAFALNMGTGAATIIMTDGQITTSDAPVLSAMISTPRVDSTARIEMQGGEIFARGHDTFAIQVIHAGIGSVVVSTGGDVTAIGEDSKGIYIHHGDQKAAPTEDVSITLGGDITTGGDGIHISTTTMSNTLVTGNGNIIGGTDLGDYGIDITAARAVTVNVNGAISGHPGILIASMNGPITIGGAGDVTGVSNGIVTDLSGGDMPKGRADMATDDITIARDGIITGGEHGIIATNRGLGDIAVTANKAVTGGTSYAISTNTFAGANTTITLNAGADVRSTAGLGIYNGEGDSTTMVNTGASVAGDIVLSDGSDKLTFAGGDLSAVTLFDGGDDIGTANGFIDALTFAGSSGALIGATVTNWESVVIDAFSTISFSDNLLIGGTLSTTVDGTLDALTGTLALTGNLANNGTVNMADGATDDIVTVSGDYTGTGRLLVDANFATDTADMLVLASSVTGGLTVISVANVTTGSSTGNDILLVDTSSASPAGAFVLSGGTITAGMYTYELEQDVNNADWYLRSSGFNSSGAVYEALPLVLSGFNRLASLEQRVHQRSSMEGSPLWVRLTGDHLMARPTQSTRWLSYESNRWGLAAGLDAALETGAVGKWVLGATLQYGQIHANVSTDIGTGTGSIRTEGYGIGATATWYGHADTYVDLQGQINWLSSDITSSEAGALASAHDSTAYALSAELGHRFDLAIGTLIPQAQLTWGQIEGDDMTDRAGSAITPGSNDTLVGRFGLAYERAFQGKGQLHVIGSILHDFSAAQATNVGATPFLAQPEALWAEIGLGGEFDLAPGQQLYGEGSYRTSLDNAYGNNGISLSAGFRVNF